MANTHSLDLEASSSQYASITDASQTGLDFSSALTFEMWIKPESLGTTTKTLISKSNSGTNDIAYQLTIESDSKLQFFASSGGSTATRNIYKQDTANLVTGVWSHVAVSFDASTEVCVMYVNGLVVANTQTGTSFSGTIHNSSEPFTIGRESLGGTLYYDGLIDDVRAWSDVRTASEIQDNLGKELVGNEANLVGYWKLNNDYTDSTSNGNDLTATNSPVFTVDVPFEDVNSIIDTTTEVLDLEASSSQYASIDDASQTGLDITGDITTEAWLKLEAQPSTNAVYVYINKGDSTGDERAYSSAYRDVSGTKYLRFGVSSDGTSTNRDLLQIAYTLPVGEWTHVAMAWDASAAQVEIFVNGLSIGTASGSQTSINNSISDFQIGGNADTSSYWDGQIRDVRIFNDIRTQSEIVSDARSTTVSDANLQGEWSFDGVYTDASGNGNTLTATNSPVFVNKANEIADSLVSYWELEETSGTRTDSHGSNDLTDNNTVLSGTGIIGNGADFESANSEYLSITDGSQTGLDLTGDLTFSFWYKPESQPATDDSISLLDKYAGTGDLRGYSFRYADTGGTKQLRASLSSDGTFANTTTTNISYTLSNGTFYHIVYAYDASAGTINVYVDGVLAGVMTGQETSIFDTTARVTVGATSADTKLLDGIIDEVGIWSRTLTAGEVSNLYNAGSGLTYDATIYTMVAAQGTYTLTGVANNLLRNLIMSATQGSYTLTGVAALFSKAYGMVASAGSYVLTGTTTGLTAMRKLVAAAGSYTLTGVSAALLKAYNLIASAGSYVLGGFSIKNVWARQDKSDAPTWTDDTKSSSIWTNDSQS